MTTDFTFFTYRVDMGLRHAEQTVAAHSRVAAKCVCKHCDPVRQLATQISVFALFCKAMLEADSPTAMAEDDRRDRLTDAR